MIVTSSRYATITYKEMMDELEAPEVPLLSLVIIMMINDTGITVMELNTKHRLKTLKNH